MKKRLRQRSTLGAALALSCLNPTQAADTGSVTFYGMMDLGIVYERKNGESSLHQKSGGRSGSRWGVRGTDDLGSGYKAVFRLEGGFKANNGMQAQERLFGRWAYVGLTGGFGEVRLGRQWVYGFEWASVGSPFGSGWSHGFNGTVLGYDDGDFGAWGRVNNAVFYTTPKFSGWQAGVGYSFEAYDDTDFPTNAHDRVFTTGARYDKGPVAAALTFERSRPDSTQPNKKEPSNLQLAGAYDFGWIKLHGTYGHLRNPNVGPSAGRDRVSSFIGGVTVPAGAGAVRVAYQRATSDISGWALGYHYALSERTDLYTYVNRRDTQRTRTVQMAAGIRHFF